MSSKKHWYNKLVNTSTDMLSWVRHIIAGSLYRISDMRSNTDISDIKTQIDTMRALAKDSQIDTALSYYATDATTTNAKGQIIWATSKIEDLSNIIDTLFKRWEVNSYAREHILELATIGNLYIPTTNMYVDNKFQYSRKSVSLGVNNIPDDNFDIIPSYKIPPEDVVHLYKEGNPVGYLMNPEEGMIGYQLHPEEDIIHFSLGGLLGDYQIRVRPTDSNIDDVYDIKFARPLMDRAAQPTQTLSLLEDALVLSSLIRTVKFLNVECGNAEEDEVNAILQTIKDAIETQLSLNTSTGDTQSFVNPQSPNNLIYLPKIKGQDAISITDLNMSDANEQDSKLLDYYQNKKLSVLGVPKEAMNFSSNEGLGGAGSVLSQRSALYANSLQRLKTAYIAGWTNALNTYFRSRGMSAFVDKFELHMTEVETTQSTVTFERRDSALSQAQAAVDLLKSCGVANADDYKSVLVEILTGALPVTASKAESWNLDLEEGVEDEI